MKTFKFVSNFNEVNASGEEIVSSGYKKAVKSFQNKYPKLKEVVVE